jgi:hypothetical protein
MNFELKLKRLLDGRLLFQKIVKLGLNEVESTILNLIENKNYTLEIFL